MNKIFHLTIATLLMFATSAHCGPMKQGIVIGLMPTNHAVLLVKPADGGADVLLRLLDVVVPDRGSKYWQISAQGVCQLLCRKEISWDVITENDDGIPGAYVYLGDEWINRAVILHGYAKVSKSPHHPELVDSERNALVAAVGLWQDKRRGDFVEAVILDGSATPAAAPAEQLALAAITPPQQ
jgi:hypothetical protein